jgi:membrane dipeptidase
MMIRLSLTIIISILFLANWCYSQDRSKASYVLSEGSAKRLVDRVLKASPVIDGHNDLLRAYFDCRECPRDLSAYRLDTRAPGQTDIPRWRKGGVGGQLLNVFGSELTPESYLNGVDLVDRIAIAYRDDLQITLSAKEVREAMLRGKIALIPSMESSVRLNNSMSLLRVFYRLGLRSVTFAYDTNEMADGSDDTPRHNGISQFGREMAKEMNRLGIMIDISHVSAKAMHEVLDVTSAPVIFSHSNVRELCDVNRNVPDDVLDRLKSNRGIIMLTFVPYFTTNEFSDWYVKGESHWEELEKRHIGDRAKVSADFSLWEKTNPQPVVTVSDMADHFDYVRRRIGVDHIGIAGDFDGIDFFIRSLEDVSTYPNLLVELARRGWTQGELRKITSGNFLRVFQDVERSAAKLQRTQQPSTVKLN